MVLLQRFDRDLGRLRQGLPLHLLLPPLASLHLLPYLESGDSRQPEKENLDHPFEPRRRQERHGRLHRLGLLGLDHRVYRRLWRHLPSDE